MFVIVKVNEPISIHENRNQKKYISIKLMIIDRFPDHSSRIIMVEESHHWN